MEKTTKAIFTYIILNFLIIGNCFAQFEPDVRLTNNPAVSEKSYNNANSIAAIGNFVHVVWHDGRAQPLPEIFYKRSTDAGVTWEADIRLTNFLSSRYYPSVGVSGQVVHVAWQDHRIGGGKIFYERSEDNGLTWGEDLQLSTGTESFSEHPSLSVSGSSVHIVWEDTRDNTEIYYIRAKSGGLVWGEETRLTVHPGVSVSASVSASGSGIHVVWVDQRDGNKEIYYKSSIDGGANWGPDTRLTADPANSDYPSVSALGTNVYVSWQDIRQGGWEIYFKRSTDGGASWGEDLRLTDQLANSFYPRILASGDMVHIAWSDVRDDNWEIYYKRSINSGLTWESDIRLTNNLLNSFYPSMAVSAASLHILWEDDRDGNYEIYYKRDSTGNLVGLIPVTSSIPENYILSQNYPNPFNPATTIRFAIQSKVKGETSNLKLIIYDLLGREITTLVNEHLKPGMYEVDWEGTNYPSGVYFYTLLAGDFSETKKMILLK